MGLNSGKTLFSQTEPRTKHYSPELRATCAMFRFAPKAVGGGQENEIQGLQEGLLADRNKGLALSLCELAKLKGGEF